MDLTETIAPRSDQMNAEDLLTGARTFLIEGVERGNAEQPVWIHLSGFPGRPYKPSKTMRRMLVAAWGADGNAYVGRSLTLYRDPDVTFGKDKVGGIKISHVSDIEKPITVALTTTRGKRAPFTVNPLPKTPAEIIAAEHRIAEAADLDTLKAIAGDLKAMNLGEYRVRLQSAWAAREAVLKSAPKEPAPSPASEPADEDYGDLLDAAIESADDTPAGDQ